jgi:hypothetical protein
MTGDTTRSEILTSILGELDVGEDVDECKAFDAVTEEFDVVTEELLEVAAVRLVDLSVGPLLEILEVNSRRLECWGCWYKRNRRWIGFEPIVVARTQQKQAEISRCCVIVFCETTWTMAFNSVVVARVKSE